MGCASSKSREERRAKKLHTHTHDLSPSTTVMPIQTFANSNTSNNNNNNNNNNNPQITSMKSKDSLYNAEVLYASVDRKTRTPTTTTQDYPLIKPVPAYPHQNQTYLQSLSTAPNNTTPNTKSREELTSNDHHQSSLLNSSLNNSQQTTHASIIKNGVYYSESELSEENSVWTPKYWTAERISKWVEEIETTPNSSSESSGRSPPHLQTVSTLS